MGKHLQKRPIGREGRTQKDNIVKEIGDTGRKERE
jgi:hypothetical protein